MAMVKKCSKVSCSNRVEPNRKYCSNHKTSSKYYNRYNSSEKVKKFFNSKEYKIFREEQITNRKECEECLAEGNHIRGRTLHYLKNVREESNYHLRLEESNTIILCYNCRNKRGF